MSFWFWPCAAPRPAWPLPPQLRKSVAEVRWTSGSGTEAVGAADFSWFPTQFRWPIPRSGPESGLITRWVRWVQSAGPNSHRSVTEARPEDPWIGLIIRRAVLSVRVSDRIRRFFKNFDLELTLISKWFYNFEWRTSYRLKIPRNSFHEPWAWEKVGFLPKKIWIWT